MKIKHWDVSVLGNKPVHKRRDMNFYTSDTDAHLQVRLTDTGLTPTSAIVTLYNDDDESLVSETRSEEHTTELQSQHSTSRMPSSA